MNSVIAMIVAKSLTNTNTDIQKGLILSAYCYVQELNGLVDPMYMAMTTHSTRT